MKTFSTVKEAFEWWLKNIYPSLPADQKVGRLTNAWKDYTYNRGISETRMREILIEQGHFEVTTTVVYKP